MGILASFFTFTLITNALFPHKATAQQTPPPELVFFLRGDAPSQPFVDLSNYRHSINLIPDGDGHNVGQVFDAELSRNVLSFFSGGYLQIPDSFGLLKLGPGNKLTIEIRVKTLAQTPLNYCQIMPPEIQPPDQMIFGKGQVNTLPRNYALGFGWYANTSSGICGSGVTAYIPSMSFCTGQMTNTSFLFNQNDLSVLVGWKIFAFELEVISNTGQFPNLPISQYPYLYTAHNFINGLDKGILTWGYSSPIFDGTLPPLHIGNGYSTWGRNQFQPNPFYGSIDYIRVFKGHLSSGDLNTNLLGPIPSAVNPPMNTPVGTSVIVQPADSQNGAQPISLTYPSVTQAGMTVLSVNAVGPSLPPSLKTGTPARYYEIASSAIFTQPVQVCINYSGISFSSETAIKLYQYKNCQWQDITTSFDTNTDVITGSASSLTTFAVLEPKPNTPPIAQCRNITLEAGANGLSRTISSQELNNGSSDPDGDALQFSADYTGPFPLGTKMVTLTVSDGRGGSSYCSSTVTVSPASPPELILFLKGTSANPFLDVSEKQHPVSMIPANGNNVSIIPDTTLGRDVFSFVNGGYLEVADNRGLLKMAAGDKLTIEINAKFFDQEPAAYSCSTSVNPPDQMLFSKGLVSGYPRNYAIGFGWYPQPNYVACGGATGYLPSYSYAGGQGTYSSIYSGTGLSGWKLFALYLEVVPNTGQSPQAYPPGTYPNLIRAVYALNGTVRGNMYIGINNSVYNGTLPPLNIGNGYSTRGTKEFQPNPFYGSIDYIRTYKGFLPQSQLNTNPTGPIPVIVNTPAGSNIAVNPVDTNTGSQPVNVTFSSVAQGGTTSLTTSSSGPAPPSGFTLGTPARYYEIATTSAYTSQIQVCIKYDGVQYQDEATLKLFHYENGQWIDCTTFLDTSNDLICGRVFSLSSFAILEQRSNHPPTANAGPDRTVAAGNGCLAAVTFDGSGSSDADENTLTYKWTWTGGSATGVNPNVTLPLGNQTITLIVNDGEADSAPDDVLIAVVDMTPPLLKAPADISVGTDPGKCGATVDLGTPTASDNCSSVSVSNNAPAGHFFSVGATLVIYTAEDASGNKSSSIQTVTVADNAPPAIGNVSADPTVLWPPDKKFTTVTIAYDVSDNCDPENQLSVRLTVTCNEKIPTSAYQIIDAHHVKLLADREGKGSGRIYTITITSTDTKGNSTTRSVQVRVPHDQGK